MLEHGPNILLEHDRAHHYTWVFQPSYAGQLALVDKDIGLYFIVRSIKSILNSILISLSLPLYPLTY